MESYKQKLLASLQEHIAHIRGVVRTELESMRILANKSMRDIARLRPEDQPVQMQLKANATRRVEELEQLDGAPYFTKLDVIEPDTGDQKTYFISKHQLSEQSIYSWVAPIASVRFDPPGETSYRTPSGETKRLDLKAKEQYMIVDGNVLFYARETKENPRDLIYQEHFTQQKSQFALPEIVAQMEKAQDQVIRAHYHGPLFISGPAGSGKTTLALHRVAYLTQAPDTAELYPTDAIIVFVQDNGTKEYFSHLLPELGIHKVTITTFSEWAMKMLGLDGYAYVPRYGATDAEKDRYEYQKITALRSGTVPPHQAQPFAVLQSAYAPQLSEAHSKLLDRQKKEKCLDRFDLTILLMSRYEKYGVFETKRTYEAVVNNILKKRTDRKKAHYALVVMDEFQNYLPEQLSLIGHTLNQHTKSSIYVGDTAQQVYLGTIKDLAQLEESISHERIVKLDKVYRNTRHILEYIQRLGFNISIPNGIKEGPEVTELHTEHAQQEIDHVMQVAERYSKGSVGILAKEESYLQQFREAFHGKPNIHVMTMNESQGVEFDLVCIVGVDENIVAVSSDDQVSSEHLTERARIHRDLLYVALTRAITELHVLGRKRLGEVLNG